MMLLFMMSLGVQFRESGGSDPFGNLPEFQTPCKWSDDLLHETAFIGLARFQLTTHPPQTVHVDILDAGYTLDTDVYFPFKLLESTDE